MSLPRGRDSSWSLIMILCPPDRSISYLNDLELGRVFLGESHQDTLRLRWVYARSLYEDEGATLDDLRESVATSEETARIARRVLGGTHPTTTGIETALRKARSALRDREPK